MVAGVPMINIVGIVDLLTINSVPELYNACLAVKKNHYTPDDRIIVRHNIHKQTLELVKEILEFIDIPEWFVDYEFIDTSVGLNFSLKKSHCILPWISLEIDNDGVVRPCCMFRSEHLRDNRPVINIAESNIKELYSSEYMRNIRSRVLTEEFITDCSGCWSNEKVGIPSARQNFKYKFKEIYYQIDYSKEDLDNLKFFDLKLGNNCNLGCNICNAMSSSTIAKNQLSAKVITINEYKQIQESAEWAESEEFWSQFDDILHNIRYLDLFGGEPLMSKPHFNFLKKLINANVAQNIKIDYNTNGTVYSEKFFEYWGQFKEVKLSFSIDDIGERFEAQRCGANWEKVLSNISRYNLKKSNKFITEVFPTINTQNVYWLPELIEWINLQGFNHVSFNILIHPDQYNIKLLPQEEKLNVINKLRQYSNYHDIIDSVIKILELSKD